MRYGEDVMRCDAMQCGFPEANGFGLGLEVGLEVQLDLNRLSLTNTCNNVKY